MAHEEGRTLFRTQLEVDVTRHLSAPIGVSQLSCRICLAVSLSVKTIITTNMALHCVCSPTEAVSEQVRREGSRDIYFRLSPD